MYTSFFISTFVVEMRCSHSILVFVWLFLSLPLTAAYHVADVPNPHQYDCTDYVSNPDGVLSSAVKSDINRLSNQIYSASGAELVVVALTSIGTDEPFDFSVNLFNRWGIGSNESNSGVLLLLVMDRHAIEIRTGGGIEGILTDARCTDIIEYDMVPLMREGKTDAAVLTAVQHIADELLTTEAQAELLLGYRPKRVTESPYDWMSIFCLLLIVWTIVQYYRQPRCPKCGRRGCTRSNIVALSPTYQRMGRGELHYRCHYCDNHWMVPYDIDRLRKSSDGGTIIITGGGMGRGGGFGGGSFGGGSTFGGGAGGRW